MDDILNKYYEHELSYFRELGVEFGKKYDNAKYLQLDRGDDPHTERLIEAFALLAAKIHKKNDEDFPSIIQSLLSVIYPIFNRPIPSMAIISFKPSNNVPDNGYEIEKGYPLNSMPIQLYSGKTHCRFQTVYPVKLFPFDISDAKFVIPNNANAEKTISIEIKSTKEKDLSVISWDELVFFIDPQFKAAFDLYELLLNHVFLVECKLFDSEKNAINIKEEDTFSIAQIVKPFGFNRNDHLISTNRDQNNKLSFQDYNTIFPGYNLLYDFFCFKEKFLFFKINGLKKLKNNKSFFSLSLLFHLNKSPKSHIQIKKETFSLYSTPIVNIFKQYADPITLNLQKLEYPVIPNRRQPDTMETFQIVNISTSTPFDAEKKIFFYPIYGKPYGNHDTNRQTKIYYWQDKRRRVSIEKQNINTEVFLTFKNEKLTQDDTAGETLTIQINCTNGNLPLKLIFDHIDENESDKKHFELQRSGAPVRQIICKVKPTASFTPFSDEKLQWKLISHLSQNFFSMISNNVEILKEMLSLYDFRDLPSNKKQINGILNITSESSTRRIKQSSFCRGTHVTIEFDKNKYTDSSLLLFASVIERFLGYLAPINSFIQVTAKIRQNDEILKTWPPRNEHMNL